MMSIVCCCWWCASVALSLNFPTRVNVPRHPTKEENRLLCLQTLCSMVKTYFRLHQILKHKIFRLGIIFSTTSARKECQDKSRLQVQDTRVVNPHCWISIKPISKRLGLCYPARGSQNCSKRWLMYFGGFMILQ